MITFERNMSFQTLAKMTLVATTLLVPLVCGTVAAAQQSSSGSTSNSSTSVNVDSAAYASGGGGYSNAQIYLDQRAPGSVTARHDYSGSYTVRSAPAVQPPSMGSGHPCALSGSIGISLIGGGAAGGMNRVDEACLLAQMGQGTAALIMISRRSPEACLALRQVGTIPANSQCTSADRRAASQQARRAAVTSRSAPMAAVPAASVTAAPIARYVTCSRNADGVIRASKRGGTPYSDQQIAAYCRGQAPQGAPTPTKPAPTAAASIERYVSCSRDAKGVIRARKRNGAPFTDDQVATFCRAQMG